MSYQRREPPASTNPPGMYMPSTRVREDPPPSIIHSSSDCEAEPSPSKQNNNNNYTHSCSLSGASSRASASKNWSVGARSSQSSTQEEIVDRLPISAEHKEKIKQVIARNQTLMSRTLISDNKSRSDSPQNDENAVPLSDAVTSNSTKIEEPSSDRAAKDDETLGPEPMNEKSPVATGSEQLEKWLNAVKKAVSANSSGVQANTEEKSLVTSPMLDKQRDGHIDAGTIDHRELSQPSPEELKEDVSSPFRNSLSPVKTKNFFPENRQDYRSVRGDCVPRKMQSFTPTKEYFAMPSIEQKSKSADMEDSKPNGKEEEGIEKVSQRNPSLQGERQVHNLMSRSTGNKEYAESKDQYVVLSKQRCLTITKDNISSFSRQDAQSQSTKKGFTSSGTRPDDSKYIMKSIEGKYKNLRSKLVEDYSVEGNSYDSQSTSSEPMDSMVSKDIPTAGYSTKDDFGLGVLSTRTSGIISTPSWDSATSYDSDNSEILFPIKGCKNLPGKGCGVFFCANLGK